MWFGLVFGFFAVEMAWLASLLQGWGYLLLWPAASFAIVSFGYFFKVPAVMGKRSDGKHQLLFRLLHIPFRALLLLSDAIRAITRRKEDPYNLIAPGLWLGRRLSSKNKLPDEVSAILDVTAEHARIRGADALDYHVLPTLDGQPPEKQALERLLDRLAPYPKTIYVHCWAGRGRSATVLAGLLLKRGVATDIDHAVEIMQMVRPQVKLSKSQRAMLESIFLTEWERPT